MAETRLSIRCEPEDKARWEAAAEEINRTLSLWVRDLLNLEIRLMAEGKPSLRQIADYYETAARLAKTDDAIPAHILRSALRVDDDKG